MGLPPVIAFFWLEDFHLEADSFAHENQLLIERGPECKMILAVLWQETDPMEEALMKLVITIPAAAAVIVTVVLFLKAQRNHQSDHNKLIEKVTARSAQCHDECTTAVKENRVVTVENTKVLTRLSTLIDTRIRQAGGG